MDIVLKHCASVAFSESDAKLPLLLACDNKLRLKGAPLIDMFWSDYDGDVLDAG